MSTSRLTLMQNAAKEFGWASGVPTSGSGTTCLDTSSDSPMSTGDSSSLFKNAWIYISADTAGTPRNVGEARRITTYTPSTQQLTCDAFAYSIATTMAYNVFLALPPIRVGIDKPMSEYINEVLRNTFYKTLSLITLAPDGDMEASGTTNYSATNATIAKVTTGAGVTHNDQALQVTNTDANGYATLATSLDVSEGEVYEVCVDVMPTTGSVKLQTWDATASAEIDISGEYAGTQARRLWLRSSIPTDCEKFNVRLISVGASDVAVWDNVSIRNTQTQFITLPSWVLSPHWIDEVWYYPPGTQRDQAYAIDERLRYFPFWWGVQENFTALVPFRLELPLTAMPPSGSHIFIEGLRPYGELATDAATTDADADWIKAKVLTRVYIDLGKSEAQRWADEAITRDKQWKPRRSRRLMTGRPS